MSLHGQQHMYGADFTTNGGPTDPLLSCAGHADRDPHRPDDPRHRAHRLDPAAAARDRPRRRVRRRGYRSRRGIERTLFRLTIVLAILFVAFSLLNLLPQV